MMKALQSSSGKLFSVGKPENGVGFLLNSKDFDFLGRSQVKVHFMNHQTHDKLCLISSQCKHKMMILPVMSSLSSEIQAEIEATDQSKTVHVKLQLQKECIFGEQILVVGDDPIFGMWDPVNAVPLEWSDDHLWCVELDIPVGRTIHFKFLLIGNSGTIVWQPDPNRVMSTWETSNVVTVLYHWEKAEFQKITEEEPIQINSSEIPIINETMFMVAENITYPKEKDGKADDVTNLESSQNEEITVEHEDEASPVLVPGLTPLNQDDRSIIMDVIKDGTDDRSIIMDIITDGTDDRSILMDIITVGTDEAESTNAPEASEEEQVTEMKVQHSSESDAQQNPALARAKELWQSDMNWGRKALQIVLANLGFNIQKE